MVYLATQILTAQTYTGTTVYLAGDSTMASQLPSRRPMTGWGEPFSSMLCNNARVINRAENGRSTKSFLTDGLWTNLISELSTGDIVMIQFGHNDQKLNNPRVYASAFEDYRENLQRFITDVRSRDATPILLTSIVRRAFDSEGNLQRTLGDYPAATRNVAFEMQAILIDVNAILYELVQSKGPVASKNWYLHLKPDSHHNYKEGIKDNTHLSAEGALEVGTLVAAELKKIRPNLVCL